MLKQLIGIFPHVMFPAMMFAVGMRCSPTLVREARRHASLLARAFVLMWLLVPLLTLAIVSALDVPGHAGGVLTLMAVCPGMPLVARMPERKVGDPTLALLILLLASVSAPVIVPVWLAIIGPALGYRLAIAPSDVVGVIAASVLVPLGLGLLTRRVAGRLTPTLARIADDVFLVALIVVLAIILSRGLEVLRQLDLSIALATFAATAGAMALGYALGGPRLPDRKALAVTGALGNIALAIAVVSLSYPGHRAGALFVCILLLRTLLVTVVGALLPRGGPVTDAGSRAAQPSRA